MENHNNKKQKTILVTGCAGFIGSHIAEKLLERGDKVIGVDEVNNYYDIKQKEENLIILNKYQNFEFHKLDIGDIEELRKIFETHIISHIAHLAARAGVRPSIENPYIYEHSNIKGSLNILDIAKDHDIENTVLTSSSSVYGNSKDIPFHEKQNVDFPISPYAATKKSMELLAHTYHHLHNMNINIIRPFTIYGPRGRPDMAPFLFPMWIHKGKSIKKFGDGTSMRDYTYIDDFVKGFISALDTQLGYEIFNLGNSTPVNLNEFIKTIEKVVGKKAEIEQHPMQPGDVEITYADTSKAERLLGYKPTVKIEEGLGNFWEWYKNFYLNNE
jgi:UDP-glucuronate 4-epimerase